MNIFKWKSEERKALKSSAFSEFIRNADAAERKKVYKAVLRKATEEQNAVIAGHSQKDR